MDTNKLLKLLNINIIDSTKDLEIPDLSKLIDNLIFAITHPHDTIKDFYRQQWDKLDKIENAVERAGKACQAARKVLKAVTPWYVPKANNEKTDDRIVLGTGYPWLESLSQDDAIQRLSLYTKRNGDGKLVNLKVGDASSSKKYRLVLEKI